MVDKSKEQTLVRVRRLAGNSVQMLLLLRSIRATQKESSEHGIPHLAPVSKDKPVQATRSTSRIPLLPTDSCHVFYSHPFLADHVS